MLIEADGPGVRSHFGALIETARRDPQIVVLQGFEMSLRDLRLEGDLLEREATGFPRAPEELTEPNAPAGLRIGRRIAACFAGVFSKHRGHRLTGLALYAPGPTRRA